MQMKEYDKKLRKYGLSHHTSRFTQIVKNCIRLSLSLVNEEEVPIGCSKIGGKPDLPSDQNWPCNGSSKPLSFLAQINFKELVDLDTTGLLPTFGIAYFFYDSDQEVWGFDPADKHGFKVFYSVRPLSNLKRADFPFDLQVQAIFKPAALGFYPEVSLPTLQSGHLPFLSPQEADNYLNNVYEYGTINKLLGYPDPIQGNMELECELVTNGIYCGDASGYQNPMATELEGNVKNWQLLLQIDSNEELGMCWGDSGRLYFWIRKEDLQNCNFSRSWMILQCY